MLNVIWSGILAASIERSRQKWFVDGVFEKYWTKPTKKKDQAEVQNPSKQSMTKLGGCQVIIEPHVFEATFYAIREVQYTVITPSGSNVQPFPTPASVPYGSPYSAIDPPLHHQAGPIAPFPPGPRLQKYIQNSQPQLPPFKEGFARFEPQGPLPPIPSTFGPSWNATASPPRPPPPLLLQHERSRSPVQESPNHADPVIQMLAARAAENDDLKSLMKIVASGTASPEELQTFQAQIDELTETVSQQNLHPPPPEYPSIKQREDLDQPLLYDNARKVPRPPIHQLLAPAEPKSMPRYEEPVYYPQMAQTPKHPPQSSQRQDIQAIAFELKYGNNDRSGERSGDRYLFPRNSILEFLPGNTEAIASFLVTCSGATTNSESYQANIDYYQPVTIRIRVGLSQLQNGLHNAKVMEVLPRAVAPSEEVCKNMNDIMDKMKPAELVHLVTQLPRTHEATPTMNDEPPKEPALDIPKRTYSPPHSLLPFRPAASR